MPIHFAYVTKHLPSNESYLALQDYGYTPIFYNELYHSLSKILKRTEQWERSPVAQLFCKYLEEEGMVYQTLTRDDESTLRLLLRQGFGLSGVTGFGKEMTAERLIQVPQLLGHLLSNVEAMGVEFHNRFKGHLGNRFMPKYGFYPTWQIERLSKSLKNTKEYDEFDYLDDDFCDGGALIIWSEGKLQSTNCYIWLGYEIEFNLHKQTLIKHLYGGVGNRRYMFEDWKKFTSFPDSAAAQKGTRRIIRSQIRRAIKSPRKVPWVKELRGLLKEIESH